MADERQRAIRIATAILSCAWLLFVPVALRAGEPTLTLSFGGEKQIFTAQQLLARDDAREIEIPDDVSYTRSMSYRAVPLADLIGPALSTDFDVIEARASDGFVSQIPAKLVKSGPTTGATAWIAVEDPALPWPKLPKREHSAGPFYLVWQNPKRANIGPEQWPFAVVALASARSPVSRWPQMDVAESLDPQAPARRGLAVFIKHCFPCHRVRGAGEATMGPDLAEPMSPTQYMTPDGLRRLIRNPAAVRTWPEQLMTGFDEDVLPESDLDDLIAYLSHMAQSKNPK